MSEIRNASIVLRNVGVSFGRDAAATEAVRNVSLTIHPGEFVVLLGPSGCGKSTLLNAIAGFHVPTAGAIIMNAETVTQPGPDRGMVFQQHSLFPWKRVIDNVAFGLKMRGISKTERLEEARKIIHWVGLSGFEQHYPAQLSGGMQQRVGIARVLINRPSVLLMDEPFCSLDSQTRLLMQELLMKIWDTYRTTVIFVTHDVDEAILLADRIIVMTSRPGRVKAQVSVDFGRPRDAELTTTVQFGRIKRQCLELIREESLKAMGVVPKSKDIRAAAKTDEIEIVLPQTTAGTADATAALSTESRRYAAMLYRN